MKPRASELNKKGSLKLSYRRADLPTRIIYENSILAGTGLGLFELMNNPD